MRADARKRCRFAPKKRLRTTHRHRNRLLQRPPDDCTLLKRKESPYWYSNIIFIEENAPQTKSQGAYLHKNFAARTPYKKAYQYRAENMKKLRKFCVKIVSLPYFY